MRPASTCSKSSSSSRCRTAVARSCGRRTWRRPPCACPHSVAEESAHGNPRRKCPVMTATAMRMMAGVVAVVGIALAGPLDAVALDKASFRLSWLISATAAPFYLGLDKGFYKAEGIDLTIEEGKGAALSAKLVAQKQDTFGMADAGVVINSIEQGMPIKMFWCHYQQNPSSVLFLKQQGIREPKDLVGKKIAGSATASHTLLLKSFLKLTAVDPAKVEVF